MPEFGPAAFILIAFVAALGGLYGATGFAGREPFQGVRR